MVPDPPPLPQSVLLCLPAAAALGTARRPSSYRNVALVAVGYYCTGLASTVPLLLVSGLLVDAVLVAVVVIPVPSGHCFLVLFYYWGGGGQTIGGR